MGFVGYYDDFALWDAVKKNDIETVKKHLPDVDPNTNLLIDLLLAAIRYGEIEMVKLLVDAGANINDPDMNALETAITVWKNDGIVEYLLSRGADITLRNYLRMNMLSSWDTDQVKRLPEKRRVIETMNNERLRVAKLLVKYGADPKNLLSLRAFDVAGHFIHIPSTSMLRYLMHHSDMHTCLEHVVNEYCPLGEVLTHWHSPLAKAVFFLQMGVSPNNGTSSKTPLGIVLGRKDADSQEELIKELLVRGADPNLAMLGRSFFDRDGLVWLTNALPTPLQLTSHTGITKLLLEHGADPNKAGVDNVTDVVGESSGYIKGNGATPLLSAIRDSDLDRVRLLIRHGADPRRGLVDEEENILESILYGFPDDCPHILRYLLENGLDPNEWLMRYVRDNNAPYVELFLRFYADPEKDGSFAVGLHKSSEKVRRLMLQWVHQKNKPRSRGFREARYRYRTGEELAPEGPLRRSHRKK